MVVLKTNLPLLLKLYTKGGGDLIYPLVYIKIMIYSTKRFSYQGKTSGALVGLSAGAFLGDKIEKKIINLKHSHSYSKDKLIKLLEDEKKESPK